MKLGRITILILLAITLIQANPRRRHHPRPYPSHHYHNSWYASRYTPYYSHYQPYRYYTPLIITTQKTTTYPTNLVMLTVDQIAKDIVSLSDLLSRGMITEKDFSRAKKTLLNRIGMSINPDAAGPTTDSIIDQIETLYHMQSGQLLTKKEYLKQKTKLLALI
ncbi:MAG: hypothetical protein U9Q77_02135 [Candidatus Marinimicrobia bacterium]|nr:hypothetical protein [Candidatus Neomarinimicrobiota bacterium]